MSIISRIKQVFEPHTIQKEVALTRRVACREIDESNATIKRAQYIKHMAEFRLAAIATWEQNYSNPLPSEIKRD